MTRSQFIQMQAAVSSSAASTATPTSVQQPTAQSLAAVASAIQGVLGDNAVAYILEVLASHDPERFSHLLELIMNMAMSFEREQFLGAAHYGRADGRVAHGNGFKPRTLKTTVGTLQLSVPQTTRTFAGSDPFFPSCLERGIRSDRALMAAAAEIYTLGVATRKVEKAFAHLGLDGLSSGQVSRANAALDTELAAWRGRSLGEVPALILDAKYEKVRVDGVVVDQAVLVAIGVLPDGHRTILGLTVASGEAEVNWRGFIQSLQERGMHGVRIIVSDAHSGLKAALRATLPSVPWQRCQFHLAQNAQNLVSRLDLRKEVGEDLRRIFTAESHIEAMRLLKLFCAKYAKSAPKLSEWAEANVPEGLTVLAMKLPAAAQKYLRTSNAIERGVNQEIERRTRTIRVFPNDASLLRLVSAVLVEIDQQWSTGHRVYMTTIAALKSTLSSSELLAQAT